MLVFLAGRHRAQHLVLDTARSFVCPAAMWVAVASRKLRRGSFWSIAYIYIFTLLSGFSFHSSESATATGAKQADPHVSPRGSPSHTPLHIHQNTWVTLNA